MSSKRKPVPSQKASDHNLSNQDDYLDDSGDDQIIGRAFWKSLLVIFGIAGLVGGLILINRSGDRKPPIQITENKAPEKREYAIQQLPMLTLSEISKEAGIQFQHYTGKEGERLLPETMGGGGGFFDFDNDLDQDILLINSAPWPWAKSKPEKPVTMKLYRNNGKGSFEDVTIPMGLDKPIYGMGFACGDFNSDGWTDLFVTGVNQCRLYQNNQGKGFFDVTDAMGVGGDPEAWSCPAIWFDYDRDGRLDLMVGHYVRWSRELDLRQGFTLTGLGRAYGPPTAFGGTYLTLYHNDGDRFTDVSESSGIQIQNPATQVPVAKSLGFVLTDANFDGWPDIVVANDTVQNFLLINNQKGGFKETGLTAGVGLDRNGVATGAMGIDCAFFRNDDNMAIAIGNFANEPSSLYLSFAGKATFSDKSNATGFGPQTKLMLTFGLFFADMDLDGRQDIVCANGHLEEEIGKVQPNQRYKQPPQVFWNAGRNDNTSDELVPLTEQQTGLDFQQPMVGRGAAYADIDGDGDLDVLMVGNGEKAKLFRNEIPKDSNHRWLRVKLHGKGGNKEASGSVVSIHYGEEVMQRCISPTRSYLSQCELPATFGFGPEITESNDPRSAGPKLIEIQWPDGAKSEHPIDGLNKLIEIAQP